MQSDSETLRHRRIQILLRNCTRFWWSSIALSLVCAVSQSMKGIVFSNIGGSLLISLISFIGLMSIHFSRKKLTANPLWSPFPWFLALTAANGVLWGLTARHGGFCLTLAIAQAGVAGMFLFSHGRLVMAATGTIAIIPIPFLFLSGDPLLAQVHLPLVALILLASAQGHRMAIKNIRNELESERLTRLLTDNQAELQVQIKKRTSEIEQANHRLSMEVQLRKEVNQALIQSEEQLNLAMTASGIGFWDWDLINRKVYHSDSERFFGTEESISKGDFSLANYVLPEDMPSVRKALSRHLKGETDYYQARYRVVLPEARQPRWLEDIGKITERRSVK